MTHDIKDMVIAELAKSLYTVLEGEGAYGIQYITGMDLEVCEYIDAQVKIIGSEITYDSKINTTNMIGKLNQLKQEQGQ